MVATLAVSLRPAAALLLLAWVGAQAPQAASEKEKLKKAAAAGDAAAQYQLGYSYYNPIDRNYAKAVRWFTKAAAQNYPGARAMVGSCYAEGSPDLIQDLPKARDWLQQAAEKGGAADFEILGGIYRWGKGGVAADWPKSLAMYAKAVAEGEQTAKKEWCHHASLFCLGEAYQHGLGTPVDLGKAFECYLKAAEQGHYYAPEKVARCYERGIGVAKDLDKARTWYTRAAKDGHLGKLALEGFEERTTGRKPSDKIPVSEDVSIILESDKAEYETYEPILMALKYRNTGKAICSFPVSHLTGFHYLFDVRDASGKIMPNPYEDKRTNAGIYTSSTTALKPGDEFVMKRWLNQCVHLANPGSYTVSVRFDRSRWGDVPVYVYPGSQGERNAADARKLSAKPIKITVRAGDPKKRVNDIDELVFAYRGTGKLPARLTEEASGNQRENCLWFLAFYNERDLIPFFLDVFDQGDKSSDLAQNYATTALQAMPDRKVVLKAFEERMQQPEKHDTIALSYAYFWLADPHAGDFDYVAERKWQQSIIEKYKDEKMQLVKQDKEYRYPQYAAGLLGGSEDLFLVNYLFRCKPDLQTLTRCASAIERVNLGKEHIPALEAMIVPVYEWSRTDAAMRQLLRLDREKYLPMLRDHPERFSPAVRKILKEEPDN